MTVDKQIFFGLTTTGKSDWRDKVDEVKQLNLREVALLPTTLSAADRKILYKLLEEAGLESAPYVHLRDDFTTEEVDYLVSRFKVKALSCHGDAASYALLDRLPKYNSIIYVENAASSEKNKLFTPENFTKHQVSGICLDLAHLTETQHSDKKHYKKLTAMLDKYPIRVNHISGVKNSVLYKFFNKTYVDHSLDSLNDLVYLKNLPPQYFSRYIVMELENSFLEQVEIKKFLETVIA